MKPSTQWLAIPLASLALSSCAQQQENYDTPSPYGYADAAPADAYGSPPQNPVYDTPAAYEDSAQVPTPPPYPNIPSNTASSGFPPVPPAPTGVSPAVPAGGGESIIHTVVKGDTLSGLSKKYNVPIQSIKQANQMTNDIVVLGRKMVIPAR